MRFVVSFFLGILAIMNPSPAGAETVNELLGNANKALKKGQTQEALTLAGKAIALDPKDPHGYFFRGMVEESIQRHAEAIADFDRTIALAPTSADPYNHRGSEHFKLGHINESLADFDRFLELKPAQKPGHWKRGIALYYAGKFDEGRKQFEGYQAVDNNDVENAVWRFLCMARAGDVDKARAAMLKIGNDRRVPMMQVYALYSGKARPEDVLAAAREGDPPANQLNERLFYAHLYLGLYHEVTGNRKEALEHLKEAENHKIGHYMWDVAHVHREVLGKEKK